PSVYRDSEALVSALLLNNATALAADDAPEMVFARANDQVAAIIPQVSRLIELPHRRHLDDAVHRFTMSDAKLAGDQTVDLSVGFADLVGFTALSQQLSTRELAASIAAFESRTAEIVAENDGRLVKLIGDEVMYVADDPGAICQVTVALLDAFDGGDIDRKSVV